MASRAFEICLNLLPLMDSSQIIIQSCFSEALDISIPVEFLHDLSHLKFDGKGTKTILDNRSCHHLLSLGCLLLHWMVVRRNGAILYPLTLFHISSNWLTSFAALSTNMNINMFFVKLIILEWNQQRNCSNNLLIDPFIFVKNFWMRMWTGSSWMKSFFS